MAQRSAFLNRLQSGAPLLLDAAMGSDLDRRGLATTLPLWSAHGLLERPDLVYQIHLENLQAVAEIITTNTFRTTTRSLDRAGLEAAQAARLDALAVEIAQKARTAAGRQDAFVAGSIAPLDDCYLPVFETPPDVALAEHAAQARNLKNAGVDLLMVETMPTATEAVLALQAALETGLPVTVGFVCAAPQAGRAIHLLSGETLQEAVEQVVTFGPTAVLVNCAAPLVITAALRELQRLTLLPTGGYANVGSVDETTGWSPDESVTGRQYAEHASDWLAAGARIVGGCCGTHPEHTAAIRALIDGLAAPSLANA